MKLNFKKSFFLPLIIFSVISFMIFAPTANILFSLPTQVRAVATEGGGMAEADGNTPIAAEPTPGPVAYGIAFAVCGAAKAIGGAIGTSMGIASATVAVPTSDIPGTTGSWSGLYTQLDECAVNLAQNKIIKWINDAVIWAAQMALNQLLMDVTNQMVKCINSYDEKTGKCDTGKKGFVVDFNKLFQNAVQTAGARFLNNLTGVNLCSITPSIKLKIALLPVPEFKMQAECTLDDIVGNIQDFYNDFRTGGWIAWKESLKPNNNAFGTWLITLDNKMAEEFKSLQKTDKETANGFKPVKKCLNPSGEDPNGPKCILAVTTTPSGTMEMITNFAAVSPIRQLEDKMSAAIYSKMGPFGVYMSAVANAFLNKLVSTGLEKVIGTVTGQDIDESDPYASIKEEAQIAVSTNQPLAIAGETVSAQTISGETLNVTVNGNKTSAKTLVGEPVDVIVKEILPSAEQTLFQQGIILVKAETKPKQNLKVKINGSPIIGETISGEIIKVALKETNPYGSQITSAANDANSQYISTGSIDENYLNLLKKSLGDIRAYLGDAATDDTAINRYSKLLTLTKGDSSQTPQVNGIQTYQNKIMDEFWAGGTKDQSTTEQLDSTPVVTDYSPYSICPNYPDANDSVCPGSILLSERKSTLIYTNTRIGKSTIQKTEQRWVDKVIIFWGYTYNVNNPRITTLYSIQSKQDQIEGVDGEITKFTQKYNALTVTKTDIDLALAEIDTALGKITSLGDDPTDAEKSAVKSAIIDAIIAIQKVLPSTNTTIPTSNTSSEDISKTLSSLLDEFTNYYSLLTSETSYQNPQTYQDYLDDVKNTYNIMYSTAHPW